MELVLSLILGFLGITILDRIWFLIDYKKIEKGMESLEHFHWGLVLFGISFVLYEYIPIIAYAMVGAATAFIYHESKQKNFFAYTSTHFKKSAVIGLGITAVIIFLYFYLLFF